MDSLSIEAFANRRALALEDLRLKNEVTIAHGLLDALLVA
jgi:hypothetical protein